jgi:hypothetical protein
MNRLPYIEPDLSQTRRQMLSDGRFDFLVPWPEPLLAPSQCAIALRGDRDRLSYVYTMIEKGKLETVGPRGRTKTRLLVTRRSLLLLIAEQFDGNPGSLLERICFLMDALPDSELHEIMRHAAGRLVPEMEVP